MQIVMIQRTPDEIAESIRGHVQRAAESIIAIGQDLAEAKEQLQHGEWLPWLRTVGFKPTTAENYMRLAAEAVQDPGLVGLGYSKALALLDVPRDERGAFVEEHNIEDKSAAETKRLVAALKEESRKRHEVEQRISEAEAARDQAALGQRMAESQVSGLRAEIARLEQKAATIPQPVVKVVEKEVKVASIPEDYEDTKRELEELREQLRAAETAAMERELTERISIESIGRAVYDFGIALNGLPFRVRELTDSTDRELLRMYVGNINLWVTQMLTALDETECSEEAQ